MHVTVSLGNSLKFAVNYFNCDIGKRKRKRKLLINITRDPKIQRNLSVQHGQTVVWAGAPSCLHLDIYMRIYEITNFVHINFGRFLSQPMSLPEPIDILITKSHLHRGPYIFINIARIINFLYIKNWLAKS